MENPHVNPLDGKSGSMVELLAALTRDELINMCLTVATQTMRLGVAALPGSTLIEQGSVKWLRAEGFDVDEFT